MDSRTTPVRLIIGALVAVSMCCSGLTIVASQPAAAEVGGCATCDGPSPEPEPDPAPDPSPSGGEGRFYGAAALFTKDGQVVDSGAGASCQDCEWKWKRACAPGQIGCSELMTCPADSGPDLERWRVYLWRGGEIVSQDTVCIGDESDIVTTEDVAEQVDRVWEAAVPPQRPTMQPPGGRTAVQLATYFHSGQPERMPATDVDVFNFTVSVSARGEWEWTFEPGVTKTVHTPGSAYGDPRPEFMHTYESVGARTVVLNTTWWGQFTVADNGPYDIDTPATQGPYELPIDVVELPNVTTAN